jgi:PAS domain S-box-containing protein
MHGPICCTNGHHWQPDPKDTIVCPVCGAPPAGPAADPVVAVEVQTLNYEPTEQLSTENLLASRDDALSAGRYQLFERMGYGSAGVVFRARDRVLGLSVALKVFHPMVGGGRIPTRRIFREAEAVARLDHPGIIRIYEVGEFESHPFIVTEFCPGGSLTDRVTGAPIAPREAVALVEAVARAAHHAHEHGIVHRDIKPSNILLGEGSPKLIDFGIAAFREEAEDVATAESQVLGTPAYMSPEQAAGMGHRVDRRSDVYSLGAVLYQLLTGELPFRGTRLALLHQVLHGEPRPPRSVNDKVPRDLETICLKAMAKEPGRRYATAEAFADDLRRFLEGEPVMARPAGLLSLSRWSRLGQRLLGALASLRGRGGRPESAPAVPRHAPPPVSAGEDAALHRSLLDTLPMGVFRKDALGRFTFVNRRFCEALGCRPQDALGRTGADLFASDLTAKDQAAERQVLDTGEVLEVVEEHARAACGPRCRCGSRGSGGPAVRYVQLLLVPVVDAAGRPAGVQGAFWDVTPRREAELRLQRAAADLERANADLARSNAELEQFAYVASHDLQEPLRMVASYTQLLQKRYQGRLDPDADEFVRFAVDGAVRMQGLIDDLLTYSRVGRREQPFATVDCNVVVDRALENLRAAVREKGAAVRRDTLPRVRGDAAQLTQLFQNLLGNALKFCRDRAPAVHVGARPDGDRAWRFAVRDNGIGIEPRHAERIFAVFQRLHGRGEYTGNGIGLAICKKVVERTAVASGWSPRRARGASFTSRSRPTRPPGRRPWGRRVRWQANPTGARWRSCW